MSGSAQRKPVGWNFKFPDNWQFDYETKAPATGPVKPAPSPKSASVVPIRSKAKPASNAAAKAPTIPAPTKLLQPSTPPASPPAAVSSALREVASPKPVAKAPTPISATPPRPVEAKPTVSRQPDQAALTAIIPAPTAKVAEQAVLPLTATAASIPEEVHPIAAVPTRFPAGRDPMAKIASLEASLKTALQTGTASARAAARAETVRTELERKLSMLQADLDQARQRIATLEPQFEAERNLRQASDARVHESEARYGEECKKTASLERQLRDTREALERQLAEARKGSSEDLSDMSSDDAARVFGRMTPDVAGVRRATTERVTVPSHGPGGRTRSVEVIHSVPQKRLTGEIPPAQLISGSPQEGTLTLAGPKQTGPRVDVSAAFRANPERMLMMQEQGGGKFLPDFGTAPPPNAKAPAKAETTIVAKEPDDSGVDAKNHPLVIDTTSFVAMAKVLPRRPELGGKVKAVLGRIRSSLSDMELAAYASAAMAGMANAEA